MIDRLSECVSQARPVLSSQMATLAHMPSVYRPDLIFTLLLLNVSLQAQTGNISGLIKTESQSAALPGAEVRLEGQTQTATADGSGRYLLLGIPSGKVNVSAQYVGMETATREVDVKAGVTAHVDFEPSPAVVRESVTVSADSNLVGRMCCKPEHSGATMLVSVGLGSRGEPEQATNERCLPRDVVLG
jgi:hypothetical protein